MTARCVVVALCALAVGLAGCGVSRESAPTGPAAAHEVSGVVQRAGAPAVAIKVKLYDDVSGVQRDSVFAGADGSYGFDGLPAGRWMVKVSGALPEDLGYVRWFFETSSPGQVVAVPPFDVSAHGFDLLMPADGAAVPRPGFSTPLTFTWTAYSAPALWSAVYLDDANGVGAWQSAQVPSTQASWNGVGNQNGYSGQVLGAVRWYWRVKLRFANDVQGASRERALDLE
jgi:hypothetical protein